MAAGGIGIYITYGFLFVSLYFEVFLLIAFIERRLARPVRQPATSSLPSVSIIVPCFNEGRTLATTVNSLLALDYPAEKLDIIIIDDGSTDNSLHIARSFEPRVRVFHKENGGKHTVMNYGFERSNAELVGCLDADSIVEPQALKRSVAVFEDPRVAATTPGIHVNKPQSILQHMQHVEYRLSVFNRFMLSALGSAYITPGPFSIFRSDVVRRLGGWRHGHSTEDLEMALRIQEAGLLIANVPGAVVHTTTPRTFRALFRQRVRWTYGFLRNATDYRYMLGNPSYGNLGILILPGALLSIGAGLYFFGRVILYASKSINSEIVRAQILGVMPHSSFDLFYIDTSALWFLIFLSVGLILVLICAGSGIGTERYAPPKSTPLFLLFYSFLVPLWLGAAVLRAVFRTGVEWR